MTTADTKSPGIAKKFILSFLGILLYMGLYALLLLPLLLLDGDAKGIALGIWGVGAFVFYLPWFLWLTKKVWFFKADPVPPLAYEKLKEELLSVNQFDAPVTVTEKKPNHFIITWKYVDAAWWELFQKAGMTSNYRLHIIFSPEKHEARLIDVETRMNWRAGLSGFHQNFTFFRGIMMQFSIGKAWGIRENFSLGKLYDYRFVPGEIKSPVLNSLLRAGWNVRFALF